MNQRKMGETEDAEHNREKILPCQSLGLDIKQKTCRSISKNIITIVFPTKDLGEKPQVRRRLSLGKQYDIQKIRRETTNLWVKNLQILNSYDASVSKF